MGISKNKICDFIRIENHILSKKDIFLISEVKPHVIGYKILPSKENFWGRTIVPERVEKMDHPITDGYSIEIIKMNNEVISIGKYYLDTINGLNDWYIEIKTIREKLIEELGFEKNPNVKEIIS